jgi:protocatechuate 3,4-dioxygenase alpha subunit
VPTDDNGTFRFMTIKPGRVPAPDGTLQAPHIVVTIFMRGLLRHLVSRIYFPGEAANAEEIERNWGQNTFCATTSSGSVPNSS